MKTYYDILGVTPQATADEIKHAFRREISRYHPDKVQHLGAEFRELAAARAADLTRAYGVLVSADSRAAYDQSLVSAWPPGPASTAEDDVLPHQARETGTEATWPAEPAGRVAERRAGDELVRKAALARFREAVVATLRDVDDLPVPGFDLAFLHRPKRGLFRKAEPDLRVLARFVQVVDGACVNEAWPLALRAERDPDRVLCVFLLGARLGETRDLATAIEANRRRSRVAPSRLALVPVDVRVWDALIPTGAPAAAKSIIERLSRRD